VFLNRRRTYKSNDGHQKKNLQFGRNLVFQNSPLLTSRSVVNSFEIRRYPFLDHGYQIICVSNSEARRDVCKMKKMNKTQNRFEIMRF